MTVVGALLVGILGAAVSLARILATNHDALSTLLWAEDGLFPLCVRKESLGACLVDPFAGYLLLLPRAVAGPVSWFPMEQWALAANLGAAILAGLAAAAVYVVLQRQHLMTGTSAFVALLPVLAPVVGFEAIGVTASGYMLLLYVMAIALAFPSQRPAAVWWYSVGLLVTALTIPSAAVLFLALIVQALRRRTSWRSTGIMSASLAVGLAGQLAVMLSAPERRDVSGSMEALDAWVQSMPSAVLTYWPGMSFGETTVLGGFPVTPFAFTGWVVVLGILAVGIGLAGAGRGRGIGIGQLLLVGLGIGAIPALTGEPNNRYYVVPLLLWAAAALIALDAAVSVHRVPILSGVIVGLLVVWWPAYPASQFRGNSAPNWQAEMARIHAACAQDPWGTIDVRFTPDWPRPETVVTEPTTSIATCASIR